MARVAGAASKRTRSTLLNGASFMEKRAPNHANDAVAGGQHHQHRWRLVSPVLRSSSTPLQPAKIGARAQMGLRAGFQLESSCPESVLAE